MAIPDQNATHSKQNNAPQQQSSSQPQSTNQQQTQKEPITRRLPPSYPYIDSKVVADRVTKNSAKYDKQRRYALERVKQLSLRRDSAQDRAEYPGLDDRPWIKCPFPAMEIAMDKGLDDAALLELWKARATDSLFQSTHSKLGLGRGPWVQYSPTTILACQAMTALLKDGDPVLKIPVAPHMRTTVDSINWWFTRATDAISFLSYLGLGKEKIGSGIVRLDLMRHVDEKNLCLEPQHRMSELAFTHWDVSPPEHPCGCVQMKTLLQLLAARGRIPFPSELGNMITAERLLRIRWEEANKGAEWMGKRREPQLGEGNKAAAVRFENGGELEFTFYKQDASVGREIRALRVEGRLGEML